MSGVADRPHGRSDAELLADVSARVRARRRAEVEEILDLLEWADHHTIESDEGAATLTEGHLDTGVPIAGPGAPLVSEFALMELIATLERTPDGGRDHVGKVIELGWRLPKILRVVLEGRCPAYRALRVADLTRGLSEAAATYVDQHLAFAVGSCSWAQVDRLVEEAVVRFDPVAADERRLAAADRRRFDIHLDDATDGVAPFEGVLDVADALDLDRAVSRRATHLEALGSTDSLDVRRAIAAGEIARQDLTLDLVVADPETGAVVRTVPGRKVELHVHLSEAALGAGTPDPAGAVGRWDDTRSPVTAEQVRQWCGVPGASVVVRPVVDVAGHVPVDSYEVPERLKARVRLRDHTCRFPYCGRRAERCDLDHARPHAAGGVTCPCNLVPACRRHHRAKTLSDWRYVVVDPGTYLWISPNGRHWLVDHRGTRALDPPTRLDPETMDVEHPWESEGRVTETVPPCPRALAAPPP